MDIRIKEKFKIALVGVEFEENLSLRYLAGSLLQAGYKQVIIQPYNSLSEAEEIVASIIKEEIDLVGVSMAFQVRAIEDMAFVQLLRKHGFKKHITAGGQFATLHYNEIFNDCPGLDSVVRFEAESAIVELADVLLTSTHLRHVSGLVWKDKNKAVVTNDTLPLPTDINELPLPFRKTNRLEFLGLKNIQMIGSRGCHATCKYCCVSALATERRLASKYAGGLSAIPGTRRRTAANIANEIANLYFKQEIRIFEFQDDNWIHPKISFAIEYFTELKNELEKRGVGKIGLTLKTRADSVQPEIIKILKEIGLIRVFVGIESGTQNLLSKLGRKSRDNGSLRALQVLRDFNVPAYFNALLFGPDIRFEEIEPELAFLEKCADFPFEIVEVVIYGKTGLYISLKEEKRLHGNYLDYEYDYLDVTTQNTHSIISQLESRHFGVYSPIKMAADLGFNLGIMQVFYPGAFTNEMAIKVAELNQKINQDQIRVIRKTAHFAETGQSMVELKEELIAETIAIDLQFYKSIIELHNEMERYVSEIAHKDNINSYYRIGAMVQSGLIASLFLTLSSGIHAQTSTDLNLKLEKNLVELIYAPNSKEWRTAKQELLSEKTPIGKYYKAVSNDVDSINQSTNQKDAIQAKENLEKLENKLSKLREERIKEDYKRLNDILIKHNPKIKIASSLYFYLDNKGRVVDVYLNNNNNNKDLSPELKSIILDLLKEKQFYTYEAREIITKHPKKKKHYTYKKQRQGPLD